MDHPISRELVEDRGCAANLLQAALSQQLLERAVRIERPLHGAALQQPVGCPHDVLSLDRVPDRLGHAIARRGLVHRLAQPRVPAERFGGYLDVPRQRRTREPLGDGPCEKELRNQRQIHLPAAGRQQAVREPADINCNPSVDPDNKFEGGTPSAERGGG